MGNKHWSCDLTAIEIAEQAKAILVGVIDEGDPAVEAVDAIQTLDDAIDLEDMSDADKRLRAATWLHCVEYDASYLEPTHDDLVKIVNAIDTWLEAT